jgi:hypothetical protein
VSVLLPNGWRFSCGGGSADSTILNGSAAWPRGTSEGRESWPRSADSYKRLLGSGATEQENAMALSQTD